MPSLVPAGVIFGHIGTHAGIPANTTRVTALDSRYVKQIATSATAPGATGGTTTHDHPFEQHSAHTIATHTHAGSWGNSATGGGGGLLRQAGATQHQQGHQHPSSGGASGTLTVTNNSAGNTATAASDPLHVTVIFVQSDGSLPGIPVNGIAWFNGAAPAGWAAYANLDNRLMKGAATGADGGAQLGTDPTAHTHTSSHTHPIVDHTHVVSLLAESPPSGPSFNDPNTSSIAVTHVHALGTSGGATGPANTDASGETTGVGDGSPPWQKMRAIQKTGSAGMTTGMICMWQGSLGSIPAGWHLADGTAGTPNLSQNKFVRAAATDGTVGDLGGAATHTHAAGTAHSHTTSGTHTHSLTTVSGMSDVTGSTNLNAGGFSVDQGHTHASTTYTSPAIAEGTTTTQATAQSANTSNDPLHTAVAYIQLTNNAPNTPSAINNPSNGQVYNTSITLSATATDPDGGTWHSLWEYSPNSGTNWFAVPGTGSEVASGSASTLAWDVSALGQGTTYTVRAWSVDPIGMSSSTLTMTGAFTIDHNLAPNAPTLVAPANAVPLDMTLAQLFDWTFSDPNVGDTQSAYALKFRRVSDSLLRWYNGTTTLATTETFNSSATDSVTVLANTFTVKGEAWAWSVATKDSGGPSGIATGPYSAERTVTWSSKVNPTITDPTAGSPATIPSATYTMAWTVGEQTQYRARLLTGAGFTTVIQDSGVTTDSATRAFALGAMANGATVRFELTTWNNEGLISNVVTQDKTVSYVPPTGPTFTIAART